STTTFSLADTERLRREPAGPRTAPRLDAAPLDAAMCTADTPGCVRGGYRGGAARHRGVQPARPRGDPGSACPRRAGRLVGVARPRGRDIRGAARRRQV